MRRHRSVFGGVPAANTDLAEGAGQEEGDNTGCANQAILKSRFGCEV
jgi:hypothetical protein